jgi:hypothetical protein
MSEQSNPPDMPPPPMASPISGPSKLVRLMRWWGLGLFALGLIVAVISGQISQDPTVRAAGPILGLVGMALYLGATVIRAFQWRRE